MIGTKPFLLFFCIGSCCLSQYLTQEKLATPSDVKPIRGETVAPNTEMVAPIEVHEKQEHPVSEVDQLKQRVAELETQMNQLQSVLFQTVKLDQVEAERRYEEAKREFEGNQQLQSRGIITSIQLDIDRFNVDQARLELLLAQSKGMPGSIAAEIDLVQAMQRLKVAQQQLENSEFQLMKGYMTQKVFDRYKQNVEDRKQEVKLQQERLNEVNKMFSK